MSDAVSMMQNRRDARMRVFQTRPEAERYSRLGFTLPPANGTPRLQQQEPQLLSLDNIPPPLLISPPLRPPVAPVVPAAIESPVTATPATSPSDSATPDTGDIGHVEKPAVVFVVTSAAAPAPAPAPTGATAPPASPAKANGNGDKPAYRGPKCQELVLFRKLIEQSKYDLVRECAWKNPRYLIGSGDTPSLLKESCRYNALHVAALAKNAQMCELLLDIIGDPRYIQLLYGKKNAHYALETSGILLDLYLNMPERGRNETPLHLAAKFGALEVVEVLTSYAQCSSRPNSEGKLPIDVSWRRSGGDGGGGRQSVACDWICSAFLCFRS